MDRHVRTTFAVIATLALMMVGIACSVVPEEKLVRDFFRASRLRDYAALGNFATATFDPQTDGQVQNLKVISVSPERSTPYPIKQYAKAFDDAKAENDSFTRDKNDYQRVNIDAIKRVVDAEVTKKPIGKKDVPIKDAWEKLREDSAKHSKTCPMHARSSIASKASPNSVCRGPAVPRPTSPSSTATWCRRMSPSTRRSRLPQGQPAQKTLTVTVERCVGKDAEGKDVTGRWIVTHVKGA